MTEQWQKPSRPYVEEALSADAVVVEERGRWVVYLDVVLASGSVRRKVADEHDERRARQSARIIEHNARRCIPRLVTRDPHEFLPPHRIDHRPVDQADDGPGPDRGEQ